MFKIYHIFFSTKIYLDTNPKSLCLPILYFYSLVYIIEKWSMNWISGLGMDLYKWVGYSFIIFSLIINGLYAFLFSKNDPKLAA